MALEGFVGEVKCQVFKCEVSVKCLSRLWVCIFVSVVTKGFKIT